MRFETALAGLTGTAVGFLTGGMLVGTVTYLHVTYLHENIQPVTIEEQSAATYLTGIISNSEGLDRKLMFTHDGVDYLVTDHNNSGNWGDSTKDRVEFSGRTLSYDQLEAANPELANKVSIAYDLAINQLLRRTQ